MISQQADSNARLCDLFDTQVGCQVLRTDVLLKPKQEKVADPRMRM